LTNGPTMVTTLTPPTHGNLATSLWETPSHILHLIVETLPADWPAGFNDEVALACILV
jgi:hypothetical protein